VPLEFLKVIVQPVALERDDDGKIIGEKLSEPTALYSAEQVAEFMQKLEIELHNANIDSKKEVTPNAG
jgi:hypothetical protein